jgi:hypothetical protein
MAYVEMPEPPNTIQRLLMERERLMHEQDQLRARLTELLERECKKLSADVDFMRERLNYLTGPDAPAGEATPGATYADRWGGSASAR